MRTYPILFVLLSVVQSGIAQQDPIQRFIDRYQQESHTSQVDLNGFVLNFTFAAKADDEIARKLTRLRAFSTEAGIDVDIKDILALHQAVQANDFEPLFQLRKGKQVVDIFIREDAANITDVLLLLSGDEGKFTLLNLEGLFKYNDLRHFDLDIDGAEELKELPAKRPKA